MKKLLIAVATLILFGCNTEIKNEKEYRKTKENAKTEIDGKIRVLNFGTAHLSQTSDANSSQIDLNDPNEKADLKSSLKKSFNLNQLLFALSWNLKTMTI